MGSTASRYDKSFFADIGSPSARSAARVVPFITERFSPCSVVDLGCGTGAWLAEFERAGVEDILGVDGAPRAEAQSLIRPDVRRVRDLSEPIDLGRTFDLVMSLEVAEHLPRHSAPTFVASIVRHGSLVLFSAAVPYQGGTGHVNEQWQSYWIERFSEHGYDVWDCIRPQFWDDREVEPCYSQNAFMFVKRGTRHSTDLSPPLMADCVHPRVFERKMKHPILLAGANALPERWRNWARARSRRFLS